MINLVKELMNSLIGIIFVNISENSEIQKWILQSENKILNLINLVIMRLTGILIIMISISHSFYFMAERFDNNLPIHLGVVGISGIMFFVLGVIAILFSGKSQRPKEIKHSIQEPENTDIPLPHQPILEQAVAAFILDLIQERQEKRANIASNKNKSSDEINIH